MTSVNQASEFHRQADFSSPLSRLCEGAACEHSRSSALSFVQPIAMMDLSYHNEAGLIAGTCGGSFANPFSLLPDRKLAGANELDGLMAFGSLLAYSRFFADAAASGQDE